MEVERVEKLRGFAEKNLERLRMQKDDGTVEVQGVLGVFRTFSEAQTTAKDDR